MTDWQITNSLFTRIKPTSVWEFMTDMSNQVRMESAVEAIELDGPFETGTKGRTIMKEYTQEWVLDEVVKEQQFTIVGQTEGQDFSLSFCWKMEGEREGTRLTQIISAKGADVENFQEILSGMEEHVPKRLAQLAEELDALAES
ncbi:MAG: hypothetical protein AAGD28_19970 [Bacteroidota bacterium]